LSLDEKKVMIRFEPHYWISLATKPAAVLLNSSKAQKKEDLP
jgi:hypothetical protein